MLLFSMLHWNAAHNDECSYHTEKRHEPTPMGLRNTGWMWSHGEREVHDSVNTVEGRAEGHNRHAIY